MTDSETISDYEYKISDGVPDDEDDDDLDPPDGLMNMETGQDSYEEGEQSENY